MPLLLLLLLLLFAAGRRAGAGPPFPRSNATAAVAVVSPRDGSTSTSVCAATCSPQGVMDYSLLIGVHNRKFRIDDPVQLLPPGAGAAQGGGPAGTRPSLYATGTSMYSLMPSSAAVATAAAAPVVGASSSPFAVPPGGLVASPLMSGGAAKWDMLRQAHAAQRLASMVGAGASPSMAAAAATGATGPAGGDVTPLPRRLCQQ